jgi:hypothetical protein
MQCRGNLLGRTVAAIEPEAQPVHRQDSRQAKAALGAISPKSTMAPAPWAQQLR